MVARGTFTSTPSVPGCPTSFPVSEQEMAWPPSTDKGARHGGMERAARSEGDSEMAPGVQPSATYLCQHEAALGVLSVALGSNGP